MLDAQASIGGAYLGLLLLLVGGIWAGLSGGHFGRGWIWAAIVVIVVMYAVASPSFVRLRAAVGIGNRGTEPDGESIASDEELAALAAKAPVVVLATTGGAGLLLILWLVVLKPF